MSDYAAYVLAVALVKAANAIQDGLIFFGVQREVYQNQHDNTLPKPPKSEASDVDS